MPASVNALTSWAEFWKWTLSAWRLSNRQAHYRIFHSKISQCTSLLPKCFQLTPDCTLLHTTTTTTTKFANKLHSLLTGDKNKYTLKSWAHPLYTLSPPPNPHRSTSATTVATMSASNVEEALEPIVCTYWWGDICFITQENCLKSPYLCSIIGCQMFLKLRIIFEN